MSGKAPRFKWKCLQCERDRMREAKRAQVRERREAEVTDLRAVHLVDRLSSQDRAEYALEGCLPLTGGLFGFTDEDLDPVPVPRGCHDCYLTSAPGSGMRCTSCPDRGLRMKRKAT